MASADGMQCQAQDVNFSQLNERIATTQCVRQYRQKWDICDFCIPKYKARSKPIHLIAVKYSKISRNIVGFEVLTLESLTFPQAADVLVAGSRINMPFAHVLPAQEAPFLIAFL